MIAGTDIERRRMEDYDFVILGVRKTANRVPVHSIEFHGPSSPDKWGKTLGALTWPDGKLAFEGDVEETAQLLFDRIVEIANDEFSSRNRHSS